MPESTESVLLDAIQEIRQNAQNLLDGGLPHFDRRDFARAVVMTCDNAIAKTKEKK